MRPAEEEDIFGCRLSLNPLFYIEDEYLKSRRVVSRDTGDDVAFSLRDREVALGEICEVIPASHDQNIRPCISETAPDAPRLAMWKCMGRVDLMSDHDLILDHDLTQLNPEFCEKFNVF